VLLNSTKILRDCLANALGLGEYCWLRQHLNEAESEEFKRRYSFFFKLRRSDAWRTEYFRYLSQVQKTGTDFKKTLRYLYEMGKTIGMKRASVEPSFASKLVAIVDPSKPIWDSHVMSCFGLVQKAINPEEKIAEALQLYAKLKDGYAELLVLKASREAIAHFDKVFPEYNDIVLSVKKLDCFLWAMGVSHKV